MRGPLSSLEVGIAVLVLGAAVSAQATEARWFGSPQAYAQLRYPSAFQDEEDSNLIFEGTFHQDIWTLPVGSRSAIVVFGQLELNQDTAGFDYNNNLEVRLGGEFRYRPIEPLVISAGVQQEFVYRDQTHEYLSGPFGFVGWSFWSSSDLRGDDYDGSLVPLRLIASSWGTYRYPETHERYDNPVFESALIVDLDWADAGDSTLATHFYAGYKSDSSDFDWNNEFELRAGLKIKHRLDDDVVVEYGVAYAWEWRFVSETFEEGPMAFINFAASWNSLDDLIPNFLD